MNSSTSISSSLVAHNELLSTIASLRSQLASTQSALYQAQQQQAGPSDSAGINATSSRSRRTSSTNVQYAYTNGSTVGDGSQLRSAPPHRRSISGSGSMLTGYPGAPPSSLATTSYSLKRDKSYEDLQSVMSAPSPISTRKNSLNSSSESNGLGLAKPQTVRRRSSSTSASSEGGLKNSAGSRIPVPAIPKGSVGTAATLAGGGSPKSPLITRSDSNGFVDSDTSFEGPRHRLQPIHISANGQDELDMTKRGPATSLPPPPSAIPRPVSPPLRPLKSSPGNVADYIDEDRQPRSATVRTTSSPFFGGSAGFTEKHAARVASSQSGTSKVIMSLQTDLTNARTQLESTRVQLRASARAVEALTRQVEDLKEQKERQRLDSQSMGTTLTRRERMLEETLSRARGAESQVKQLEEEKKAHNAECSKRLKDYDSRLREAEERKSKAESEYNALKGATNALSEGWKRDVRAYKKEQANLKLLAEKDANAAKARQASTSKLIAGRTSAKQDIDTALQDLSRWQANIQKQYEGQIQQLQQQSAESERENEILRQRTQEVLDELAKYKHAMRTFDPAAHTAH